MCVVGTDNDWETEGNDRESMALPPPQDELVRAVAAANPQTIVVVNAASPVEMPWADDVAAIMQAWFPGEEWGNALADVLSGDVSPSGKLPTTIPRRIEDTPAFTSYPGERGAGALRRRRVRRLPLVRRARIEPRFPFGHGLSYTTFEFGEPSWDGERVHVRVTNTGSRARRGSRAVLRARRRGVGCAAAARAEGVSRRCGSIRASRRGRLPLDERAFAFWDVARARGRSNPASSSCASARRRATSDQRRATVTK